ncbi:transcriptional repressor [Ectothiorhodospiraceae bacterium WFHF3C12]|nr:transcriptional repressor [Ectothiorhodospiraceae bacterium WFHF3C12]
MTSTERDIRRRLHGAGLRATRQRIELAGLLFGDAHRHVTAEQIHREARQAGIRASLATVYNTLNQFTATGLLREINVDPQRCYYDTNTSHHHHFFHEDEGRLVDIPAEELPVGALPRPPAGTEVRGVEVVIRVATGR